MSIELDPTSYQEFTTKNTNFLMANYETTISLASNNLSDLIILKLPALLGKQYNYAALIHQFMIVTDSSDYQAIACATPDDFTDLEYLLYVINIDEQYTETNLGIFFWDPTNVDNPKLYLKVFNASVATMNYVKVRVSIEVLGTNTSIQG